VQHWKDIIAIFAGSHHTIGIKKDGSVVATGWNAQHQCEVVTWKNVCSPSAGCDHTVALLNDGTLIETGDNRYGQCDL